MALFIGGRAGAAWKSVKKPSVGVGGGSISGEIAASNPTSPRLPSGRGVGRRTPSLNNSRLLKLAAVRNQLGGSLIAVEKPTEVRDVWRDDNLIFDMLTAQFGLEVTSNFPLVAIQACKYVSWLLSQLADVFSFLWTVVTTSWDGIVYLVFGVGRSINQRLKVYFTRKNDDSKSLSAWASETPVPEMKKHNNVKQSTKDHVTAKATQSSSVGSPRSGSVLVPQKVTSLRQQAVIASTTAPSVTVKNSGKITVRTTVPLLDVSPPNVPTTVTIEDETDAEVATASADDGPPSGFRSIQPTAVSECPLRLASSTPPSLIRDLKNSQPLSPSSIVDLASTSTDELVTNKNSKLFEEFYWEDSPAYFEGSDGAFGTSRDADEGEWITSTGKGAKKSTTTTTQVGAINDQEQLAAGRVKRGTLLTQQLKNKGFEAAMSSSSNMQLLKNAKSKNNGSAKPLLSMKSVTTATVAATIPSPKGSTTAHLEGTISNIRKAPHAATLPPPSTLTLSEPSTCVPSPSVPPISYVAAVAPIASVPATDLKPTIANGESIVPFHSQSQFQSNRTPNQRRSMSSHGPTGRHPNATFLPHSRSSSSSALTTPPEQAYPAMKYKNFLPPQRFREGTNKRGAALLRTLSSSDRDDKPAHASTSGYGEASGLHTERYSEERVRSASTTNSVKSMSESFVTDVEDHSSISDGSEGNTRSHPSGDRTDRAGYTHALQHPPMSIGEYGRGGMANMSQDAQVEQGYLTAGSGMSVIALPSPEQVAAMAMAGYTVMMGPEGQLVPVVNINGLYFPAINMIDGLHPVMFPLDGGAAVPITMMPSYYGSTDGEVTGTVFETAVASSTGGIPVEVEDGSIQGDKVDANANAMMAQMNMYQYCMQLYQAQQQMAGSVGVGDGSPVTMPFQMQLDAMGNMIPMSMSLPHGMMSTSAEGVPINWEGGMMDPSSYGMQIPMVGEYNQHTHHEGSNPRLVAEVETRSPRSRRVDRSPRDGFAPSSSPRGQSFTFSSREVDIISAVRQQM